MKRLDINDTFYNLTQDDLSLRQAFIDMGFEPMSSDMTYKTVGKVITLKKAIEHVKMDIESVNEYLKEKGLEVELYE